MTKSRKAAGLGWGGLERLDRVRESHGERERERRWVEGDKTSSQARLADLCFAQI